MTTSATEGEAGDRLTERLAIQRLNDDFGHELDRGTADGFAGLFTEDALYTFGERVTRGRDALHAFFERRSALGPRVSRHLASGLRVEFVDDDEATGISVCATFSAAGHAPVDHTDVVLVADFVDRYRRVDGRWYFAERHIVAQFGASALPQDIATET